VAEAERLAGSDLKPWLALCQPAPAVRPAQEVVDKLLAAQISRAAPEPGKAFDELYYVGSAWVSAWAIKTSQGIILIDALNNGPEAERLIDGADAQARARSRGYPADYRDARARRSLWRRGVPGAALPLWGRGERDRLAAARGQARIQFAALGTAAEVRRGGATSA
jgi:hypothetical protein